MDKHLFQNDFVTVRVNKCRIDTDKNVMLPSLIYWVFGLLQMKCQRYLLQSAGDSLKSSPNNMLSYIYLVHRSLFTFRNDSLISYVILSVSLLLFILMFSLVYGFPPLLYALLYTGFLTLLLLFRLPLFILLLLVEDSFSILLA